MDDVFVRINCATQFLWRAVDHEGDVLEAFVTKRRDHKAALRFLRKSMEARRLQYRKYAAQSIMNQMSQILR